MPLDPAFHAAVLERFSSTPFPKWMGMSLVAIDDGSCELRIDVEPHHLNPGQIVHGGIIATLLDACIGLALRTKIGASSHVTVQLGVHYLSPATGSVLLGRGTAVHSGRRMGYGEAEIVGEDGRRIAKGTGTFLILDRPLPGLAPTAPPAGDA